MHKKQLIHTRVIDTAHVFPHPNGVPYRFSLRALVQEHLGRFIQQSTGGHDSMEDALSTLHLLQKKLKSMKNS